MINETQNKTHPEEIIQALLNNGWKLETLEKRHKSVSKMFNQVYTQTGNN